MYVRACYEYYCVISDPDGELASGLDALDFGEDASLDHYGIVGDTMGHVLFSLDATLCGPWKRTPRSFLVTPWDLISRSHVHTYSVRTYILYPGEWRGQFQLVFCCPVRTNCSGGENLRALASFSTIPYHG